VASLKYINFRGRRAPYVYESTRIAARQKHVAFHQLEADHHREATHVTYAPTRSTPPPSSIYYNPPQVPADSPRTYVTAGALLGAAAGLLDLGGTAHHHDLRGGYISLFCCLFNLGGVLGGTTTGRHPYPSELIYAKKCA
jgi:hypothetical protein